MPCPHYVGAWDSVAWCREARMTFRNAFVVYSLASPNAPCSIRPVALFCCCRMRYQRVPGVREWRRGPYKKPRMKGRSRSAQSPLSCAATAGMCQAGRLDLRADSPLMNFEKGLFSFKAGCELTSCRLAKHRGGKEGERRGGERRRLVGGGEVEGGAGKVSWHLGRWGYWMSLTVRDNRPLCIRSHSRSILDPCHEGLKRIEGM